MNVYFKSVTGCNPNINLMLIFKEIAIEEVSRKVSESAEKSAENNADGLSKRQKQILEYMEKEVLYSTKEIANAIGLKGPRTRQLLNELVEIGVVDCTAATKNRRYVKR